LSGQLLLTLVILVGTDVMSAAMLAMEKDHADELARLKNASDKELLKVQQEKYVLSVVSYTVIFFFNFLIKVSVFLTVFIKPTHKSGGFMQ